MLGGHIDRCAVSRAGGGEPSAGLEDQAAGIDRHRAATGVEIAGRRHEDATGAEVERRARGHGDRRAHDARIGQRAAGEIARDGRIGTVRCDDSNIRIGDVS